MSLRLSEALSSLTELLPSTPLEDGENADEHTLSHEVRERETGSSPREVCCRQPAQDGPRPVRDGEQNDQPHRSTRTARQHSGVCPVHEVRHAHRYQQRTRKRVQFAEPSGECEHAHAGEQTRPTVDP